MIPLIQMTERSFQRHMVHIPSSKGFGATSFLRVSWSFRMSHPRQLKLYKGRELLNPRKAWRFRRLAAVGVYEYALTRADVTISLVPEWFRADVRVFSSMRYLDRYVCIYVCILCMSCMPNCVHTYHNMHIYYTYISSVYIYIYIFTYVRLCYIHRHAYIYIYIYRWMPYASL